MIFGDCAGWILTWEAKASSGARKNIPTGAALKIPQRPLHPALKTAFQTQGVQLSMSPGPPSEQQTGTSALCERAAQQEPSWKHHLGESWCSCAPQPEATHGVTWSWHLEWQSRVMSKEAKGGLHVGEVDLGLTADGSGDKAPSDCFCALVGSSLLIELCVTEELNRHLCVPKKSDAVMACCNISGWQSRYNHLNI